MSYRFLIRTPVPPIHPLWEGGGGRLYFLYPLGEDMGYVLGYVLEYVLGYALGYVLGYVLGYKTHDYPNCF